MPQPNSTVAPTPTEWFVGELAAQLDLGTRSVDLRRRRILQRLVSWSTAQGIPLEREAIFDPAVIEAFCSRALAGEPSRGTHRADLRRVARQLTVKAAWEPPPEAMAWRKVAVPYSQEQLGQLVVDARDQPTEVRRRAARCFLALGLGAGLDGRWIAAVGPSDVAAADGHVEVRVGEPAPRRIVVRAAFEEEVLALAESAGDGCLLGLRC